LVALVLVVCTQPVWSATGKSPTAEPAYTKGEDPARTDVPCVLGPTSAFGHIWHADPRLIQGASIAKGSPADGKLDLWVIGRLDQRIDLSIRSTAFRKANKLLYPRDLRSRVMGHS
jgi:hypothetical protein